MYVHLNLKKAYNYRLILSKYQTLILKKKNSHIILKEKFKVKLVRPFKAHLCIHKQNQIHKEYY